jgi:hypothetical protein
MAEPAAGSTFRPHIPFLFYDVIGRMMPGSYLILGAVLCWPAFIQGAVCFLKDSHALGMSGGLAAVLIGTGLILFGFISSFFGFLLAPLSYLVVEQWLWRRSPLNDSDLVKFLGIESASSLNERFKRQFGSERSKNSLNRSSFLCAYYVWQTATALGEMQGRFDSDLLASQSFVLVSLFLFLVLLIEAIRGISTYVLVLLIAVILIGTASLLAFGYHRKKRVYGRFGIFLAITGPSQIKEGDKANP